MAHKAIQPNMLYYGFPVILLTSCDKSGKSNITPISSSWCLNGNIVIGLSTESKAFDNLKVCPEAVLNLPDENLWQNVEAIAAVTAKYPIPSFKQGLYQFNEDKFHLGNFTAQLSQQVKPARIKECPLQIETTVLEIMERANSYSIIVLQVQQVHADERILFGENKIDPTCWKPLIYNFRHYQGLTPMKGKNFRAEI